MRATSTWQLPPGWIPIRSQTWGPFVVRELVRRPDGEVVELSARRHRKGRRPTTPDDRITAPRAHAVIWAPQDIGWCVGVLFIVGSACFATGSIPTLSSHVSPRVISSIFFVGSLWFTSAGYLQYVQAISATGVGEQVRRRWFALSPRGLGWYSAAIQLLGTVFFNVTTFAALHTGYTVHQQNLRIWSPDFFGSICFLIASWLAIEEVRSPDGPRWRWSDLAWRIVWLNMLGSVFFMASAIAAYVRPATGDVLSASIDNSGTFLGAVCFLSAAWLLLVELVEPTPSTPDRTPVDHRDA
jgi:hypothetical protein